MTIRLKLYETCRKLTNDKENVFTIVVKGQNLNQRNIAITKKSIGVEE